MIAEDAGTDPEHYCREVESHLCRRNDGHLVRLVGPSFDMVFGWASRGIPLRIALAGIDQCFERYHRKGPRRRPMQVAFAEADVLDLFDAWRRAVGVPLEPAVSRATDGGVSETGESLDADHTRSRSAVSLRAHLDRVIARLTVLRARPEVDVPRQDALSAAIRELDAMRATARTLRGEGRAAALARLEAIDAALADIFREGLDPARREALEREAQAQLLPFRRRMPETAWRAAVDAATSRLAREAAGLPVVRYE